MRVTQEIMEQNNLRIVTEAARLFRLKGIEDTSVTDVMSASGLTHGGFYRHFQSKDELVAVAINKVFTDKAALLKEAMKEQSSKQVMTEFVKNYLSEQHISNIDGGCPIPALASEVDRKSSTLKKVMGQGTEQLLALLSLAVIGTVTEKKVKAIRLLSIMVGSVVIARASPTNLQNEILLSAYQQTHSILNES